MYGIPPWLTASDPASEYLRGIQTGAQIGESQSRLQEAQVRAQMEQQARQERLAQNALMAKTRLDYEHAYKTQALDLQNQKLEEAKKINAAKTAQDAMALNDSIGFANYLKQNPGDVVGGLIKFPNVYGRNLTAMTREGGGQPFTPEVLTLPDGTKLAALGPKRFQVLNKSYELTGEQKVDDESLKAQISELHRAINSKDYLNEEKAKFRQQIDALTERRKALYRKPVPVPKSATEQYEPGMLNPIPEAVLPSAPVAPAAAQTNAPAAAEPTRVKGTKDAPAKIQSQEDFDSLEKGEYFINPADGKLMRKK